VAESLVTIRDPLETILRFGPAAPAEVVARSLARSLAPLEADISPPAWLLPDQVAPFRRVVHALRRHGGALLADPVGSGKTFVALAVAHRVSPGRPPFALVPAVLRPQWEATAARLGVPCTIGTHQGASRGRLPERAPPLVIIDESHHFRHTEILRYRHVAPWLVGATVLLLSATPVVNGLADLTHQLLLGVRDDTLSARGCPSLSAALGTGDVPPALGDLVLSRPAPAALPRGRTRSEVTVLTEAQHRLLEGIDRLALSPDSGIAALIRGGLWRALASSPGALLGALRRYAALLHHAMSAAAAGQPVTRALIRQWCGPEQGQLVLWAMLGGGDTALDLVAEDATPLEHIVALAAESAAASDPKASRLRALLGEPTPTIVFTGFRDTLHWLRRLEARGQVAWVTGAGAGIGHAPLPREVVLGAFAPASRPGARATQVLLATDVAAEGLDLQCAGRVVHYDLPWTSVRFDQRNGRALRLGAALPTIEIVEFTPPPQIEVRLGQLDRLLETRRLSTRAGIDQDGRWLYRWRVDLAAELGGGLARAGMAVVDGDEEGWLAGFALDAVDPGGVVTEMPATLIWIGDDGDPSEAPPRLFSLLLDLARRPWRAPTGEERAAALDRLGPIVRGRLREAAGVPWRAPASGGPQRRLERTLRAEAGSAQRARDHRRLERTEALRQVLAGGLTAGESLLVAHAGAAQPLALERALAPLLRRPRYPETLVPRITGVVRVVSFRG
jgi:predicted alpha/beta-hydrolase family hydrolase